MGYTSTGYIHFFPMNSLSSRRLHPGSRQPSLGSSLLLDIVFALLCKEFSRALLSLHSCYVKKVSGLPFLVLHRLLSTVLSIIFPSSALGIDVILFGRFLPIVQLLGEILVPNIPNLFLILGPVIGVNSYSLIAGSGCFVFN